MTSSVTGIRMIWIALAICGVVCTGVATVYGPPLAKNIIPQFFVSRAILPIAQEFMSDMETIQNLIIELQENPWRQDANFGLNHLRGDIAQNIDPTMLSAAPLAAVRSVLRWDNVQEIYVAQVSLQVAVTNLISANFHMDQNSIYANIPILFDYWIDANPRSLASDWNNSIFGGFSSFIITDDTFYEMYRAVLFDTREQLSDLNFSKFLESLRALPEYITFEYLGQNVYDEYLLTIPAENVNESLSILFETLVETMPYLPNQLTLNEDLIINVFIDGSRLVRVNFDGSQLFGGSLIVSDINSAGNLRNAVSSNRNIVDFEIFINQEQQTEQLDNQNQINIWGDWSNNNISLNFNVDGVASLNSEITILPERNRIEANIRELNLINDDMDLSINVRYSIYPDTAPIVIDRESERLLTNLNSFDLIPMAARAINSPLGELIGLGDFLGNLIW